MAPIWIDGLKGFVRSPVGFARSYFRYKYADKEKRWDPPESLHDEWRERSQMMAAMIPQEASVLEFGSGKEYIREWLPEGCRYVPSDIVARTPHTLVCNLNESYPSLEERFDVVMLSGVIEYIHDLHGLFAWIRKHAGCVLVSYSIRDKLSCMRSRWNSDFVNHLTNQELSELFAAAGFTVEQQADWKLQRIYKLV